MATMREILNSIPEPQRRQLEYALQHSICQFVKIGNTNKFIGVHVIGVPHLDVEERVGSWSTGTIKGVNNADSGVRVQKT